MYPVVRSNRMCNPQAGASTEEVMNCMKAELSKSGLSEEEILQKTLTVMKAFGRGDESDGDSSLVELSLASRQKNSALKEANISPKDFAKVGRTRTRREGADPQKELLPRFCPKLGDREQIKRESLPARHAILQGGGGGV